MSNCERWFFVKLGSQSGLWKVFIFSWHHQNRTIIIVFLKFQKCYVIISFIKTNQFSLSLRFLNLLVGYFSGPEAPISELANFIFAEQNGIDYVMEYKVRFYYLFFTLCLVLYIEMLEFNYDKHCMDMLQISNVHEKCRQVLTRMHNCTKRKT